jgi:peroxiredoxin
MNKTHHIILTLALLLLLPVTALALNQGSSLIPFSGQDMDGNAVDLSTVIGKKPIMLIFWASWCPNCKSEVPKVNGLVKKYQNRGMEFLGINVGHNDSEAKARRFMEATGMAYPVIFDRKGTIARQYGVQGVPTVLIADKKGMIVFKNYGVPEISEDIFQRLNQ